MLKKNMLAIAMVSIITLVALIATNTLGTETSSDEVVTPSQSGLAGYVKFSGVDGEATEINHNKWSELLAFDQGYHQPMPGSTTGPVRRRGDVIVDDITIEKELDKASPKIAEGCTKGKVFGKVDVELTRHFDAGNVVYYKFELVNVVVTSYTIRSEDVNNEFPTETMTLTFEEVKVTYTETDEDGSSKGNTEYEWKVDKGDD